MHMGQKKGQCGQGVVMSGKYKEREGGAEANMIRPYRPWQGIF